jgi:hypothetical protein
LASRLAEVSTKAEAISPKFFAQEFLRTWAGSFIKAYSAFTSAFGAGVFLTAGFAAAGFLAAGLSVLVFLSVAEALAGEAAAGLRVAIGRRVAGLSALAGASFVPAVVTAASADFSSEAAAFSVRSGRAGRFWPSRLCGRLLLWRDAPRSAGAKALLRAVGSGLFFSHSA